MYPSIRIIDFCLTGRADPTNSHPFQEVLSNKGRCFNVVIAMFKSADINIRSQGQPSEAPDEGPAPGTAIHRKCAESIFFYWMWGCPSLRSITYLFNQKCIPQRKILGIDLGNPLILWFLLNVCQYTVLEDAAKSTSQQHEILQLLVVGLPPLQVQRRKAQMLTKVMITEVIRIIYTHTWLKFRHRECPPGSSGTIELGTDVVILVPPIGSLCQQAPSGSNSTGLEFEER